MSKKKNASGRKNKKGRAIEDSGKIKGLSTKSYKPPVKKSAKAEAPAVAVKAERKPLSRRARIIILVTSVVLLLAIAFGIVAGVLHYKEVTYRADYLNDDLSKFVSLDRSAYDGYSVTIDIPAVNARDIENALLQKLAEKKGDILFDGDYVLNRRLNPGDKAYIWYRGYELAEDGSKTELSGTSNLFDENVTELEIGSGKFVTGFELDLLGKMAEDTSHFERVTTGDILDTDVVYLVATCSQEVGELYYESNIRIDLADPKLESVWGEGIREYIQGIGIGNKTTELKELKTPAGDSVTFTSAEIKFATRAESEARPVTVKAVFPHDYDSAEFRNKTVYFDVYIEKTLHYEPAVFNDEFVESLGYNEASLAGYEGGSLTDKYRNMLREELVAERQEEIDLAVQQAVWDNMMAKAVFHKLPEGDVTAAFDDYYYRLKSEYFYSFTDSFTTLEDFIIANFELEAGDDWEGHIRELVSENVKVDLLYFYVLQTEGLIPTEAEFRSAYREYLEREYERAYKKTREDFTSDASYEAALAKYEENTKLAYGEDFITNEVYFEMRIDDIVGMANVVNAAE